MVILLTDSYLSRDLGQYELQAAYGYQAESQIDNYAILVLLEHIAVTDQRLPEQLKSQLKRRNYIEWTDNPDGQKLFWEMLKEALVKPSKPDNDRPYRVGNDRNNANDGSNQEVAVTITAAQLP